MQTLQQTLVEERDKVVQNANQQRSMLEESLHSTKSEEQRLRTKLAEAEEVCVIVWFHYREPSHYIGGRSDRLSFLLFCDQT